MARLGLFQPFPRGNSTGRWLLVLCAGMIGYGAVMVASATEGVAALSGSTYHLMMLDAIWIGMGSLVLWVTTRIRLELLVRLGPLWLVTGLGMLLAVLAIGVRLNGGKRWISFGTHVQIQPSEFFKLFLVLYVAWVVTRYHRYLANYQYLLLAATPIAAGLGLILMEHDLGTTSIVAMIAFAMLIDAGMTIFQCTVTVGLGVTAAVLYGVADGTTAKRFLAFLHPNSQTAGANYQLTQSKIAIGDGGWTGLGYGNSRAKWGLLPSPHTDFIFSTISEELGFLGALFVLVLFIAFLYFATRVIRNCTNQTYRLIAVGITTWIALEAIINMASVVGLWAITGVPLPFFSYGGSALVVNMAAVGLLYSIANDSSVSEPLTLHADGEPLVAFKSRSVRAAMHHPRATPVRHAPTRPVRQHPPRQR